MSFQVPRERGMTQVTGNASRQPGFIVYSLYPVTTTTSPTERVGRYQLLEPIGIGPSGTVSRAKVFGVAGFERQFAVKRFHPELTATAAMAAMLSAAARAYGSLEHPRIARMSEFGVAQGSTFTAVEYVLGLDALRLIGEARLAGASSSGLVAGGALALVSQAARAVGYAHGRGLTHLGLAPTNVIVTAEGDIKITDFGILSATLPQRPIDVARLAQRIPYLAPEQLANEATSAATDVFALGVLAYELVTGNRTFKGETPQQIASAIMSGPPAEPLLPRPIVRVLQRCLARSPFERFPDARALADALDAALRVAPVPGTRKDIGAQVKDTLDRLAALNEGQMSGMVALHLGTGPIRRPEDDEARRAPADAPEAPYELASSAAGHAGPAGPAGGAGEPAAPPTPATTLPDLQRPPMTVPGVPPPPIPVPPGVGGLPSSTPPTSAGAPTLLGVGKTPPALPAIKPMQRPGTASGSPAKPPAVPAAALRPGRAATDLSIPIEVVPPGPPEATTESAIHLLPGDLMPIDAIPGEPALDGEPPTEAGAASLPSASVSRPPSSPGLERGDAPAEPEATPDASPVGTAPDTTSSRVASAAPADEASPPSDPHTTDTRPFAQVGTPLFDPIVRSTELPMLFNVPLAPDEPGPATGDRRAAASEPSEPASPVPAAGAPTPSSGPIAANRTILGFAAPLVSPRAATPSPAPTGEPPVEDRARDELSGMALEGFHAVAAPPGPVPAPASQGWPREGAGGGPDEAQHDPPPLAPPLAPPMAQLPPQLSPQPLAVIPMPEPPPPQEMPAQLAQELPMPMPPQLPATPVPPGWTAPQPPGPPTAMPGAPARRRLLWILVGMIGAAIIGVGGWQIYVRATAPSAEPAPGQIRVTKSQRDASTSDSAGSAERAAIAAADAAEAPATTSDAAAVVATASDAAVAAAPPDAARLTAAPGTSSGSADKLSIASTPPGARVYLDGSDAGATPVTLPGSPDRHNLALVLAGHELYQAQVDGHGTFQIQLKEVTPSNGPAGIKVLRCKTKDRYYVFVDGKPTGQTCPTERIGCEVGAHTVEVYDAVSETRRKWDFVVNDTRLSFRIRVE
jgi:serine/threonine-protein kinase